MKNVLKTLMFVLLCQASTFTYAIDFQYKEVKDFKVLNAFPSVEAFEAHYNQYVGDCLDNTYGGTGGIPCYIGYEMWDRELNIYYKQLYSRLDEQGRQLLKLSQRAWLKERDQSMEFVHQQLGQKYSEPGTMYSLMRVGEFDTMITPIVKQRALLLRQWIELFEEN